MFRLIKIFAFLLLVAFTTEISSSLWMQVSSSVVMTEKDEKDDKGTEKEESKDKINPYSSIIPIDSDRQKLFVLSHTYFKYSVYLSLPEIPPDLS